MADVVKQGGTTGSFLILPCVPDSTFKAEITALIAAGTDVVGKYVQFTWSANYEVTSPAAGAAPSGEIISYKKTTLAAGNSYSLSVRVFQYVDQNGTYHSPHAVLTMPYSGTIALQDTPQIKDSGYDSVDDGGATGIGAVIAKDTTNTTVDILF